MHSGGHISVMTWMLLLKDKKKEVLSQRFHVTLLMAEIPQFEDRWTAERKVHFSIPGSITQPTATGWVYTQLAVEKKEKKEKKK